MDNKYVKVLTGSCNDLSSETAEKLSQYFTYQPDDWQKHCFRAIDDQEDLVVLAHTGSGKTSIAEYVMHRAVEEGKKVIYCSPIKTLSNQKFKDFSESYPSVGVVTGDIIRNPNAQVLVMTTEILKNLLSRPPMEVEEGAMSTVNLSPTILADVKAIVFDEIHYINNRDRGEVWEKSIIMMPKEVMMIGLSATIENAEYFGQWISNMRNKPISLVPTSHRVVPLEHYVYVNEKLIKVVDRLDVFSMQGYNQAYQEDKDMRKGRRHISPYPIVNSLLDDLRDLNYFPVIIFEFSKANCERYAKSIQGNYTDVDTIGQIRSIFEKSMAPYRSRYEMTDQYNMVRDLLYKGVGVHHAGLIPVLKEVIEILFGKGLIKILFATETFAVGVNFPAKCVCFTTWQKYDSTTGFRLMNTPEYKQMAGRAGRRGKDDRGISILVDLKELIDSQTMSQMMVGSNAKIKSKFSFSYQFVLKTIQSSKSLIEMAKSSLLNQELMTRHAQCQNLIYAKSNRELFLPEDEQEKFERYHEIQTRLDDRMIRLKKKQMKQMTQEKRLIEDDVKGFVAKYKSYCDFLNVKKEVASLIAEQEAIDQMFTDDLKVTLDFLTESGYIGMVDSIEDIDEKSLTLKGIVAAEIQECNEIILTEIITNGYLDDLEFAEIVAVMALFINEKNDELFLSDLSLDKKAIDVLKDINQLTCKYEDEESKAGIVLNNSWSLSLGFVEPAYRWAMGESGPVILSGSGIYEGNFIKNMIRLNNMISQVKNICELIQNDELRKKLEDSESILIKDFVTIESLYL